MSTSNDSLDLFEIPSLNREEIGLLADAVTALYVEVAMAASMNRRTAHEARRHGDGERADIYDQQANQMDQRARSVVALAEDLGIGIEGDGSDDEAVEG